MSEETSIWHNRQIVFDRYFRLIFGFLVATIVALSFILIKLPETEVAATAQSSTNPIIDDQIKQLEQWTVKAAVVTSPGKINLKTATITELDTLDGIGEKRAALIVALRNEGKLASVNDLQRVKGIGEKLFNSIKENIVWE